MVPPPGQPLYKEWVDTLLYNDMRGSEVLILLTLKKILMGFMIFVDRLLKIRHNYFNARRLTGTQKEI